MHVLGIILARSDSTRLPGKVLLDLGQNFRMIDLVAARARRATRLSALTLATTTRTIDDELAFHAEQRLGIRVFRGATDDVASRALECAEEQGAAYYLRLNADSPFPDPKLIDAGISLAESSNSDLVTNLLPRTYPYGTAVEIFRTAACRRVIDSFDETQREHVSQFFYRHPERFQIQSMPASPDPSMCTVRLTVDDPEDLRRVRHIILKLGPDAETADYERIVEIWRGLEGSNESNPDRLD